MKRILAGALAALLLLVCLAGCGGAKKYTAVISIKDYGDITVKLDSKAAPKTVENFVKLAESGFYNGLTFHRIINGFMMQGGASMDANNQPENIKGEFSANGVKNELSHVRGTISMARTAVDMDSANSQFFITQVDCPTLDGQYAAFGTVTSGIEIVDQICETAPVTDNNGTVPAESQPVIDTITITEV